MEKIRNTFGNQELTNGVFEMLRTAVNVARYEHCLSIFSLKARLAQLCPGRKEDIDAAIAYWGLHVARQNPKGVPRG